MTDRHPAPWWTATGPPSWVADALLALAIAVFQLAATGAIAHADDDPLPAPAVALLLVSGLSLALRRRQPVAVLVIVFAATFGYELAGYQMGPIWLPLIVAFFTAQTRGHRIAGTVALAAGYTISLLHDWSVGSALGLAALLLALLAIAEVVRARRAYDSEESRRRQGEERLRIARELHDVLAHNISLINVRANVGLHLLDEQPEEARAALRAIKGASGEALGELRSVLETLRAPEDALERAPAPRLAQLDALVDQAASAGLAATTEISGEQRPLPGNVELAAYRIVQEGLTNVIRHAGPASATIRLVYGERELTVEVLDDGTGASSAPRAGGAGLLGMRERAAGLGGEVEVGPRTDGSRGFRVHARLPIAGTA